MQVKFGLENHLERDHQEKLRHNFEG